MNTALLSGRLTKDPEIRVTQNELSVATFTLAVNRPGVKDKTDFISCVAWRGTADFIGKYFHKGDPMEVQGVVTTRSYDDKAGNKRYVTEVLCDRVMFTPSKPKDGGTQAQAPAASSAADDIPEGFEEITDEDIPF